MNLAPTSARGWIGPVVVGVLATIAYLLTAQRALVGDGIFFLDLLEEGRPYSHVLYLPLVRATDALLSVFGGGGAQQAMLLTSAVGGGLLVALTGLVANRVLAGTVALPAALLTAGLYGTWFHATATELHSVHGAAATALLLGLLLAQSVPRLRTLHIVLLAILVVLTVGTHLTGVVVVLPILVVAIMRPAQCRGVLLVLAVAAVTFVPLYLWIYSRDAGVAGYTENHLAKMLQILRRPPAEWFGVLLEYGRGCLAEWAIFSTPVSTLAAGGLRVLWHKNRDAASVALAFVVAWPLLVFTIEDRFYGAYHVPTYAAQVLLAAAALQAGGRWAGILLLLAFAPGLALFLGYGEPGALVAWSVGSILCAVLVRPAGSPSKWPLWVAAFIALFATGAIRSLGCHSDPIRSEIVRMQRTLSNGDQVLLLSADVIRHKHWMRFLPAAEDRVINPNALDYPPPSTVDAEAWRQGLLKSYERRLQTAGVIYALGEWQHPGYREHGRAWIERLARACQWESVRLGESAGGSSTAGTLVVWRMRRVSPR